MEHPKQIKECAEFLWKNRKKLVLNGEPWFDYPDYGGLPAKISGRLTSDQVDWIQQMLPLDENTSKAKLKKGLLAWKLLGEL